jgi:hypothetical protein
VRRQAGQITAWERRISADAGQARGAAGGQEALTARLARLASSLSEYAVSRGGVQIGHYQFANTPDWARSLPTTCVHGGSMPWLASPMVFVDHRPERRSGGRAEDCTTIVRRRDQGGLADWSGEIQTPAYGAGWWSVGRLGSTPRQAARRTPERCLTAHPSVFPTIGPASPGHRQFSQATNEHVGAPVSLLIGDGDSQLRKRRH